MKGAAAAGPEPGLRRRHRRALWKEETTWRSGEGAGAGGDHVSPAPAPPFGEEGRGRGSPHPPTHPRPRPRGVRVSVRPPIARCSSVTSRRSCKRARRSCAPEGSELLSFKTPFCSTCRWGWFLKGSTRAVLHANWGSFALQGETPKDIRVSGKELTKIQRTLSKKSSQTPFSIGIQGNINVTVETRPREEKSKEAGDTDFSVLLQLITRIGQNVIN